LFNEAWKFGASYCYYADKSRYRNKAVLIYINKFSELAISIMGGGFIASK
jgi:hypothetical protein